MSAVAEASTIADAGAPLPIAAVVGATEQRAVVAAAHQLVESTHGAGYKLRIRLSFLPSLTAIDMGAPRSIVIASFLSDVFTDETWTQTHRRWRAQVAPLAGKAAPATFLCTVFRHVAGSPRDPSMERIRRLNLLATELSHDFGFNVADIDRVFAHFGARELGTDCRLTGPVAAEVAGYVIADAVLASALDHLIPPEVQEQARQFQGPLETLNDLVARRLRSRQAGAADGRA